MDTEQPTGSGQSIENRMAAVFGASEPAPEVAPEAQAAPEPEAPETSDEAPETPPEDDGEDFDVDGTVYKLPRDLKAKVAEWKEGALRREDYTRKTQEVADMHRQVTAMAEAAHARQQFEQSVQAEREELASVKADMARYKGLDWTSLDMETHVKLRSQLEQLKDRAKELDGTLQGKHEQFSKWTAGKRQELVQQGNKFLASTIPGWGAEKVKGVAEAAKSVGYTAEEIDGVFDVRFVRLAHKAAEYDRLMSGKQAALATAQKAPPIIKPGVGQGQKAEVNQRFKDTRASLRKSGSVDDAARLIQMMSK